MGPLPAPPPCAAPRKAGTFTAETAAAASAKAAEARQRRALAKTPAEIATMAIGDLLFVHREVLALLKVRTSGGSSQLVYMDRLDALKLAASTSGELLDRSQGKARPVAPAEAGDPSDYRAILASFEDVPPARVTDRAQRPAGRDAPRVEPSSDTLDGAPDEQGPRAAGDDALWEARLSEADDGQGQGAA